MKSVSLKDLKENFSSWAERAARGETVQVTKHHHPYVTLLPSLPSFVTMGKRVGKESLRSRLNVNTKGKSIEYLLEDREDKI